MSNYTLAGNGLRMMFIAQILILASVLFAFIPVLGAILIWVGVIGGFVLSLVGLNQAGPTHPGFKRAMALTIANIVVNLGFTQSADGSMLNTLLGIVSTILSLFVTYCVCTAASQLLSEKGDQYQADLGMLIWKLYLGCALVGLVCSVLAVIPLINLLGGAIGAIAALVELIAGILYLVFLYKASQSLMS